MFLGLIIWSWKTNWYAFSWGVVSLLLPVLPYIFNSLWRTRAGELSLFSLTCFGVFHVQFTFSYLCWQYLICISSEVSYRQKSHNRLCDLMAPTISSPAFPEMFPEPWVLECCVDVSIELHNSPCSFLFTMSLTKVMGYYLKMWFVRNARIYYI